MYPYPCFVTGNKCIWKYKSLTLKPFGLASQHFISMGYKDEVTFI